MVLTMALLGGGVALANPFYSGLSASTAAATSTQAFLRPGVGTTTPIYDSYELYGTNQTNGGNQTIPDVVSVMLNGTASSTASTFAVQCEYSNNYNGITGNGDWYQDEVLPATSTVPVGIASPISYSFAYASSTPGAGGIPTNTNRFMKVIECPVPLRFVRAVITVTGANGTVWASIVPTKQRN